MSKRYPGNFVTGNPVALSQTSNNGIWDVKDVSAAVGAGTWQEPDGVYEISKSLRCRYSSTGSLIKNSNLPTPSNPSKWTVSMWVKRGNLAYNTNYYYSLFGKTVSAGANFAIYFSYSGSTYQDSITWTFSNSYSLETRQLFRDVNSWYHLVFVWDSANSVASERAKMYVNGTQITDYVVDGRGSVGTGMDCWNTTNTGYTGAIGAISANSTTPSSSLDGQIAEFINVDGQCLDPSYFGYTNPVTNIWQPKQYTGSYGNAGGYYKFTDTQSTYNLGRNFAGSNYFTYSQLGNDSSYTYNNASVTINNTTAPDGSTTGNFLKQDSTAGVTHRYYKNYGSQPSGTVFTTGVYVKSNGTTKIVAVENWNGSTNAQAFFNIETGQPMYSLGWPVGSGYEFVGNGWYRVWCGNPTPGNGSGNPSIALYLCDNSGNVSFNGNNTSGCYFWGNSANLGTTIDRYIATTSTAALNDWNPYGLSLTPGTTYDSMVDSPTNVFTSVTDTGGVVPGNYATWNSTVGGNYNNVGSTGSTIITFSEGGLRCDNNAASGYAPRMQCWSTIGMTTGKWYAEFTNMSNMNCGISKGPIITGTGNGIDSTVHYGDSGSFSAVNGATGTEFGTPVSYSTSDVIGVAFDADIGTITFYKNGTSVGGFTSLTTPTSIYEANRPWFFSRSPGSSGSPASMTANFGQRPFAHTPPAGYKSLNTTNIQALGTAGVSNAAVRANQWFDITSYTGTGTANNVVNPSGMGPDLVMIKSTTSAGYNIAVADTARGAQNTLFLDLTSTGEQSDLGYWLSSINSNGFSIAGSGGSATSYASTDYTAWQWKQSPTSGFNIVTYTGNGVDNRNITHNLGVTPKVCLIHARNDGSVRSWPMFTFLTTQSSGNVFTSSTFNVGSKSGGVLSANLTAAMGTYGMDGQTNANGTNYVAYLWTDVPGFSKTGVYYANNTGDGPVIWTGFTPKYILIRSTSGARDWLVYDRNRRIYNGYNYSLTRAGAQSFTSAAAYAGSSGYSDAVDFLSTGFKFRNAGSPNYNASSETYFYMAFAEAPFALNNRAI